MLAPGSQTPSRRRRTRLGQIHSNRLPSLEPGPRVERGGTSDRMLHRAATRVPAQGREDEERARDTNHPICTRKSNISCVPSENPALYISNRNRLALRSFEGADRPARRVPSLPRRRKRERPRHVSRPLPPPCEAPKDGSPSSLAGAPACDLAHPAFFGPIPLLRAAGSDLSSPSGMSRDARLGSAGNQVTSLRPRRSSHGWHR